MKFQNSFFIALLCLLFCAGLQAQQDAHYSQFTSNKLAFNPAYAGSKDAFTLMGLVRQQWVGIEGGPSTQVISGHGPFFKDKVGLGLTIVRDRVAIINNWNVNFAYSYRLKLAKGTLGVGLQASMRRLSVDWSAVQAYHIQDIYLPTENGSQFFPNFGVGFYYQTKKYYVGASLPDLLKSEIPFDEADGSGGVSIQYYTEDAKHFYLMGGLIFNLSDNVKFKPAALVKVVPNAPLDIDLNASFLLFDRLWLGASYRWEDSIDGIVQYQFNKQLKVGIAYDYTLTALQQFNSGSFEILGEYTFEFDEDKLINLRYF